ncbi:hypothetical protein DL95DRAFT_396960 [Leptodontidium sp. 2 PMI_412]|nr:hypothetical protein DL95DRAFT_396960 [Leptodontidium sp. 2 PMI_412]
MATESTSTDLVLRSRDDEANYDNNPARPTASDQSPSQDESRPNPTVQVELNIMYASGAPYNGFGTRRRRPSRAPRGPPRAGRAIEPIEEFGEFLIWFWDGPVKQFFGWLKTLVWVFVGLVVGLLITAPFTTASTDFVLALVTLILDRE